MKLGSVEEVGFLTLNGPVLITTLKNKQTTCVIMKCQSLLLSIVNHCMLKSTFWLKVCFIWTHLSLYVRTSIYVHWVFYIHYSINIYIYKYILLFNIFISLLFYIHYFNLYLYIYYFMVDNLHNNPSVNTLIQLLQKKDKEIDYLND